MLHVTINAKGKTWTDLGDAVREALRLIEEENWSGFDRNEDGSYEFQASGTDESEDDELDDRDPLHNPRHIQHLTEDAHE